MKKTVLVIILLIVLCVHTFGQEEVSEPKSGVVPLYMVFHNVGWNALHIFTHNYGWNFGAAVLSTFILIDTGLDWQWNRLAYNNEWMPAAGNITNYLGYGVPVLTPIAFYLTGLAFKNEKAQLAGMALAQSFMFTLSIQAPLKMITSRAWTGITDGWDSPNSSKSDRTDDYSGEFYWFTFDVIGGWPSGHVAHAFSAAATLSQIYHDKTWVKVVAYTYASIMALGMSVYDHWASDVIAGALIGLAIGNTVGRSFRSLAEGKQEKFSFYVTPNSMGVVFRI